MFATVSLFLLLFFALLLMGSVLFLNLFEKNNQVFIETKSYILHMKWFLPKGESNIDIYV